MYDNTTRKGLFRMFIFRNIHFLYRPRILGGTADANSTDGVLGIGKQHVPSTGKSLIRQEALYVRMYGVLTSPTNTLSIFRFSDSFPKKLDW